MKVRGAQHLSGQTQPKKKAHEDLHDTCDAQIAASDRCYSANDDRLKIVGWLNQVTYEVVKISVKTLDSAPSEPISQTPTLTAIRVGYACPKTCTPLELSGA